MGSEVRAGNGSLWQERGKRCLSLGYSVGKLDLWIWSGSLSASKKPLGISGNVVLQLRGASWGIVGNVVLKAPQSTWSFEKLFALKKHKGKGC